jgi:DNA-directed RNA polymerase subunit RPC12/RpoP
MRLKSRCYILTFYPERVKRKIKGVLMAEKFYCKKCGRPYPSVFALTSASCQRDSGKRCELYEGSEKTQYTCKKCGRPYPSIFSLTGASCQRDPGKRCEPAL